MSNTVGIVGVGNMGGGMARAAGFEGALGPVAHEAFNRAVAAGDAELDDAALFRLFRSS